MKSLFAKTNFIFKDHVFYYVMMFLLLVSSFFNLGQKTTTAVSLRLIGMNI